MPKVVLVRPGRTDFDDQDRIQGSLDVPLNSRGEDQVQEIVAGLSDIPLGIVLTAPCEPARATADAIGEHFDVRVKELDGLRNLDQGLWQGLPRDEVRRKHPRVFKQWQESPETICPPEGEAIPEVLERIHRALEKPLKKKASVVIVASEPLATLVGCVLKGTRPEFVGSFCGCSDRPLVEIIDVGKRTEAAKTDEYVKAESVADTGMVTRGDS